MVSGTSLPSPPADDMKPSIRKVPMSTSTAKQLKPNHRSKASTSASAMRLDQYAHSCGMEGRHKRVWKACERCRMKKTKCDGEFPCKRCKDDGLVCAAGIRKKMEYKQLPKGYAEVLENTQFALIGTVQKLYSMVRKNERWTLGEPELNEHGEPVIHNIAQLLGCIRPNSDIDLPVHAIFPEDSAGLAELARKLELQQQLQERRHQQQQQQQEQQRQQQQQEQQRQQQQQQQEHHRQQQQRRQQQLHQLQQRRQQQSQPQPPLQRLPLKKEPKTFRTQVTPQMFSHTDRASSSDLDHSDIELSYRRAAFGSSSSSVNHPMAMSPESLGGSVDFDFGTTATTPADLGPSGVGLFPSPSPVIANMPEWGVGKVNTQTDDMALSFLQSTGPLQHMDPMTTSTDFSIIKPELLSACANPNLMMGMGDPTMFPGYEDDNMRL